MSKVSFYIDGFNLYHSIKNTSYDLNLKGRGIKWVNIYSLCHSFLHRLGKEAAIEDVYYFSAFATHLDNANESVKRHRIFVRAIETTGVKFVKGRFKPKTIHYSSDRLKLSLITHEEKQSDVALGINIINDIHTKKLDHIIILSGDGDLVPVVNMVHNVVKNITIRFAFPYKRHNVTLKRLAPESFNIEPKSYLSNQFPNTIKIKNVKTINKPTEW